MGRRGRRSSPRGARPAAPGPGPGSLRGELDRLTLEVNDAHALAESWATVAGRVRTRELDVVVRSWRPPVPGWLGRPAAVPGLRELSVDVRPDESVGVRIGVVSAVDAAVLVAAALQLLLPHRPDHGPGTADVAVSVPLDGVGSFLAPRVVELVPADQHEGPHVRRTDVLVGLASAEESDADIGTRARLRLGRTTLTALGAGGERERSSTVVDATRFNPVERAVTGECAQVGQGADGRLMVTSRSVSRTLGGPVPSADDLAALAPVVQATIGPEVDVRRHLPGLLALMACGIALGLAPRPEPVDAPDRLVALWMDVRTGDALRTWASSIGQRRHVLRHHAVESVLRRAGARAGDLPEAPTVSVVLSTMRPDLLAPIVARVAAFDYPHVQLVVGVHGDVDPALAEKALRAHAPGLDHVVLHRSADVAFGAVLGDLSARADGALITKIDDDDDYGPQHLWDLVLARDFSGAQVVGKPPEFVYLEALDITVRRSGYRVERYGPFVAGGTMLISRADLDSVGGWRPVPRSVDRGLLDRVHRDGGLVYSTHGLGYLYVRHSAGHTWDPGLDHFLTKNVAQWPGRPVDVDTMTFRSRPTVIT